MLRDADTAMYKAKVNGKARYALFDAVLHTEVSHRLRLERDLRRALGGGQLSVAYQPIFDLGRRRITGFEAFARWNHRELGPISPHLVHRDRRRGRPDRPAHRFRAAHRVPAAARVAAARRRRSPSSTMHVNVSGNDLAHPGLVARVTGSARRAQLQPRHLTLELTENILMQRLEAALPTLHELRRLGVGLSLDDFGTGYSSLRHLSTLPVNSLEDRPRLRPRACSAAPTKPPCCAPSSCSATSLGKSIIAEGIESRRQLEQLRKMGCTAGQGYYLARPLAAERVDRMLDALVAKALAATGQPGVQPGLVLH